MEKAKEAWMEWAEGWWKEELEIEGLKGGNALCYFQDL